MTYERAASMMSYVGCYYGRSRIYKAQNETKGTEFDLLRSMIDAIADQFFVETATWGIDRWEQCCGLQSNDSDSIEVRRQRVISWLQIISPITPKVLQRLCSSCINAPVEIKKTSQPYTYAVCFDYPFTPLNAISNLQSVLEEAKPAHLFFWVQPQFHFSDLVAIHHRLRSLSIKSGVDIFGIATVFWDGSRNLDGSWLLSAIFTRGPHFSMFDFCCTDQVRIQSSACITQNTMWHLDGSVLLDASRCLSADIEIIEL